VGFFYFNFERYNKNLLFKFKLGVTLPKIILLDFFTYCVY